MSIRGTVVMEDQEARVNGNLLAVCGADDPIAEAANRAAPFEGQEVEVFGAPGQIGDTPVFCMTGIQAVGEEAAAEAVAMEAPATIAIAGESAEFAVMGTVTVAKKAAKAPRKTAKKPAKKAAPVRKVAKKAARKAARKAGKTTAKAAKARKAAKATRTAKAARAAKGAKRSATAKRSAKKAAKKAARSKRRR